MVFNCGTYGDYFGDNNTVKCIGCKKFFHIQCVCTEDMKTHGKSRLEVQGMRSTEVRLFSQH